MGLTSEQSGGSKIYVKALNSVCKFAIKSDKENPLAVAREYEDKNDKKQVAYELHYSKLSGHIVGLEFTDGAFGQALEVSIKDGADDFILSLPTGGAFYKNLVAKLPNISLEEQVEFNIYKNNKDRATFYVAQGKDKLEDHFYDFEEKKAKNGYTMPKGGWLKATSDDKEEANFLNKKLFKKTVEDVISKGFHNPAGVKDEMPSLAAKEAEDDAPF